MTVGERFGERVDRNLASLFVMRCATMEHARWAMWIDELLWDEGNIEHLGRHQVVPEEAEEVVFQDAPIAVRARAGRYAVYGQTAAGRYIVIFLDTVRVGRRRQPLMYRPVTVREMTEAERRRYQSLK